MAMGRPSIHQRAMTPAERQRRSWALRGAVVDGMEPDSRGSCVEAEGFDW